ncbi:MAG: cell division protein [Halobacteriaceae archaeon]
MQVALVGVGQAGGKLVDALRTFDVDAGFGAVWSALAVNTAESDLAPLDVETMLVGRDRVGGHGVGGDNELGAEIMSAAATEVLNRLDAGLTSGVEAVVVVAGLGGGTGSGGAPVLADRLREVYDRPVYCLGVLPGRSEGSMYAANAGRSLVTLLESADATLLVDNDAWHEEGESVTEAYETINRRIARRVGLLLGAGESTEGVGESVVDTSEVINTLRGGSIAALGYASVAAAEDAADNVSAVGSVARKALLSGMSLPDASDARTALLVIAGRPDAIPRKGTERARRWVEDETGSREVRGGDFPLDSDRLAALLLLGGVERSGRVQAFLDRAREAAGTEETADPAAAFANDDLDGLF